MKTRYLLLSICMLCVSSFMLNAQPTDMTSKITNPSFEDNVDAMATGWTYEGGCDAYVWNTINTDGDETKDGNNICGLWNATFGDVAITQTITGLDNGEYKVTAGLMCAANAVSSRLTTQRIFANNSSVLYGANSDYSTETVSVLTGTLGETLSYAGNPVSTTAENGPFLVCEVTTIVTDGTLKIGIKTNGTDSAYPFTFPNLTDGDGWGWFKTDNFTLTFLGATGIDKASLKDDIKVIVTNGFITVDGAESFEVYDLCGSFIPNGKKMSRGVYIVKANAQVKKVFVN